MLFSLQIGVVLVIAAIVAAAVVGMFALLALPYVLAWRLRRRIAAQTTQRGSRGETIPLTGLARLGLGTLSPGVGFVASLGEGAAPQQTLNQLILRPTIGARLSSLALAGVVIVLVLGDQGGLAADMPYLVPAVFAAILYGFLHTQTYTLRYDTDGLITRDSLFRQQQAAWRDVVSVRDNGHYLYVIALATGQKITVPKYLVGIRAFLTYANDQMAYHNRL